MFLVDSSGSIKETDPYDWDRVLQFLNEAILGLNSLGDMRFSVVLFSHEAHLQFNLDRFTNVNQVVNEVASAFYVGGTTDITAGLQLIRNEVVPKARPDAAKIIILLSDGKPNEQVQYINLDSFKLQ